MKLFGLPTLSVLGPLKPIGAIALGPSINHVGAQVRQSVRETGANVTAATLYGAGRAAVEVEQAKDDLFDFVNLAKIGAISLAVIAGSYAAIKVAGAVKGLKE